MDSINPLAAPNVAMTHIQKMAPGPPVTTAIAIPAILPTPTREAVEIQKAWKGEMCPSGLGVRDPSRTQRNISLTLVIWTKRVQNVNQRPTQIKSPIRTYDQRTLFKEETIEANQSI